jgi:tetratricopeptide (TPR) repeat protein
MSSSDDPDVEKIDAADYQEQARDALGSDRPGAALGLIERSLELAPESFDAWSLKAKILVSLDRGDDALAAVDEALALVPDDYDALAEKSGILSMYLGDLESGLTFARRAYVAMLSNVTPAQRSDPNGTDFWAVENVYDNLYYALYRLKLFDDAAKVRTEAGSFGHDFAEGTEDDPDIEVPEASA